MERLLEAWWVKSDITQQKTTVSCAGCHISYPLKSGDERSLFNMCNLQDL